MGIVIDRRRRTLPTYTHFTQRQSWAAVSPQSAMLPIQRFTECHCDGCNNADCTTRNSFHSLRWSVSHSEDSESFNTRRYERLGTDPGLFSSVCNECCLDLHWKYSINLTCWKALWWIVVLDCKLIRRFESGSATRRLMAGSDDVVSDEYAWRNYFHSTRITKSH